MIDKDYTDELDKYIIKQGFPDCEFQSRIVQSYRDGFISLRWAKDSLFEYHRLKDVE